MFKYFRKYNSWILIVGGTLLMVIFLLPQLPQMMGAGVRNPVIATFTGGEIHLQDRQQAASELGILSQMQLSFGFPLTALLLNDPDITEREAPELWMLLVAMAQRDGLVGGPEDGRNLPGALARRVVQIQLEQIQGLDATQSTDYFDSIRVSLEQQLEASRTRLLGTGTSALQLDLLFAKARGVLRMYELYEDSVKLSEPETRRFASRVLDQVGVQWVVVRANRFFDQLPEIDEQDYIDHFEKYKDVAPGTGEHGFGYRRYPGYRVEWYEIERTDISENIVIDPLEANTYFQQNRAQFPGEWSTVKDDVFETLRQQEVDTILAGIDREIVAELRSSQGQLERDDDGYFIIPENWDLMQPSLESIKSQIETYVSEQHNLPGFSKAVVVRLLSTWNIDSDIQGYPSADATMRHNGKLRTAADMMVDVNALYPDSETKTQAEILYGPAVTPEGKVYYFRVAQTRPAGPPDNAMEVRERVAVDYNRYMLYFGLNQVRDSLINRYIEVGIDEYADQLITDPLKNVVVSREGMEPYQTRDFNTQKIRDEIMAHAAKFDPTKRTYSYPVRERLLIVDIPIAFSYAIVEILDVRPLSKELYQERKLEAESLAKQELRNKILKQWPYTWERLQATQEYISLDINTDDSDDLPEQDAGDTPDPDNQDDSG